jgi:hypothetical protein
MRFPPPEVMASWPVPNYKDPVTRGPALMIVELTILPVALICVALRLWVRIRWLRKSWWDDWLMVVAAVCLESHDEFDALLTLLDLLLRNHNSCHLG